MKLLLDENLSPRLVPRLLSLFADLTHVGHVGLRHANDKSIWGWAKENGYSVITSNADFVAVSQRLGWPPKVIRIEQCDFPFRVIEDLLRRSAGRITDFEKNRQRRGHLATNLHGSPGFAILKSAFHLNRTLSGRYARVSGLPSAPMRING